jgi:hypothetical protein
MKEERVKLKGTNTSRSKIIISIPKRMTTYLLKVMKRWKEMFSSWPKK